MFVVSHDYGCVCCMGNGYVWVKNMLEVIEVVDVVFARDKVCVAVVAVVCAA